ncbi:MAG: hypothetical protein ABJO86_19075 [Lentilitoribacter sp.]
MARIRDVEQGDKYRDKLGKILPGELTATYFLIRSLAGESPSLSPYLLLLAIVLCAVFFAVSPKLIELATVRNRILYCVTFVFWVAAIDNYRFAVDVLTAPAEQVTIIVFMTSGLAAIWSFFVPHVMDQRS